MYRIKVLNQLNGRQREKVRDLENLCRKHDEIQGQVALTPENPADVLVFFLGYEGDLLVGFATMYLVGKNTAEICGYIHPECRKHTLYKKMLAAIRKEAVRIGIKESNIAHEPYAQDCFEKIAEEENIEYLYSEYLMEWKYSYQLPPANMLTVLPITEAEICQAAELISGAFPITLAEAEERIRKLTEEGCCTYGAWEQKKLLGTFSLSFGKESVYLYDFTVEGDSQGRGVGRAMLKELIRLVQTQTAESGLPPKKIRLQVGSRNEMAFRLYQKNGFQVISQRDYYQVM